MQPIETDFSIRFGGAKLRCRNMSRPNETMRKPARTTIRRPMSLIIATIIGSLAPGPWPIGSQKGDLAIERLQRGAVYVLLLMDESQIIRNDRQHLLRKDA